MRRWCLILLGLLTALVAGPPVRAEGGSVGKPVAVCIRVATSGASARTLFAAASRFDCATPQPAFGPGDFDVVSAPLRVGADRPARVRFASLWQRGVTLHALYADGAIATLRGGARGVSPLIQLGAVVEQELPKRGVPVVRLLWRVEGAANVRGILVGAHLSWPSESARFNVAMAALYAAFGGLCVALLFYNLALWAAMRHRFQLAYCAMLVALLVYGLSSSGALAWLWPSLHNNNRLRINYLSLALSGVAALVFARSFFEQTVFAGVLGRVTSIVSGTLLATAVAFVTLAPWQARMLDRLYAVSFVALLLLTAPVLVQAWRRRSNYLWLFTLGWAIPIAFAGVRIAANLQLIAWRLWIDHSTIVAMGAEALLSSLAIAYRIRLLGRERDEARAQETAARLLADTDPLTGLLNRRAFLREATGRPGRHVLLLCDMDHFKRINEAIGHDGGDDVLRLFARTLRGATGSGALVARLGGEEFAVLAEAKSAPAADAILQVLRAEQMPFAVAVTASIGVSAGPIASEGDWKALYAAADRALFAAKAAGRDRAWMDVQAA